MTEPVSGGEIRHHVVVRGRVQGVGFRYWTQQEALRRGLAGFVRNRRDGAVEVLFSGAARPVAGMLAALQEGPAGARVDAVETMETEAALPDPLPGERFSMLPTL